MQGIGRLKLNDKKHSLRGIIGTTLGVLVILIQIISMFVIAFSTVENDTNIFGLLGIFCFIFSLSGLIVSIAGFKEEETFMTFPIIGTILNIFMVTAYIWLFIVGTL
jgi:hypothetical protein